jgi:predicted DNA-binding protein
MGTPRVQINIGLPPPLAERLEACAERLHLTKTEIILSAMEAHLAELENEERHDEKTSND